MKTSKSLTASRDAAIKGALAAADFIYTNLSAWKERQDRGLKTKMPSIRSALADLNQRIHEANAYDNSLNTD